MVKKWIKPRGKSAVCVDKDYEDKIMEKKTVSKKKKSKKEDNE